MAKWMLVRLARGKLADGTRALCGADRPRARDARDHPAQSRPGPRAGPAEGPFPGLRPRPRHPRLPRPPRHRPHRGPARLRLDRDAPPGTEPGRRHPDQRRVDVGFLRPDPADRGLRPRRPAHGLGGGLSQARRPDRRPDGRGRGQVRRGPRGLVQAVAPAREVRRSLHGRLVRRRGRRGSRRQAGHALLQDPRPRRGHGALAVRYLHRPLARPGAPGRRLCHLRPQPGRLDRPGQDGSRLAGDRFQLRFPGPRSAAGAQALR